ncbi:MAG: STAS domain-containing protein [Acidobacteriota bacterium]
MSHPFSLDLSERGDIIVLQLSGYLDAHTAPEFEAAVQEQIESGKVRLVADAGPLSYISSAGLGVFMGFVEELRDLGGDIKIAALEPKVAQVFELLGFQDLFDIVENVETAVQRFQEAPSAATESASSSSGALG